MMTCSKTVWGLCVLLALTLVRPALAQEAPPPAPPGAQQASAELPAIQQSPAQQLPEEQPPAPQPPTQPAPAQPASTQQPLTQQPPSQQPPTQQPPTQPQPAQPPPTQQPPQPTQPSDQAQQTPEKSDPDLRLDVLQPDFTLAALPTTLRLPRNKLSFRVTHRFQRPLAQGDFGDLISNFFGLDEGANIGLELRYGLFSGTQVGVYRTSESQTIEIFGQQSILQEKPDGHRLSLDALATIEGEK